jgi:pilus assembly protein CpaF
LVLPRDGVSREHCVLFLRDESYHLRDLGSRKGTVVDGAPIAEDTPLESGMRFDIAGFEIQFRHKGTSKQKPPTRSGVKSSMASMTSRSTAGVGGGGGDENYRRIREECHTLLLNNKDLKRLDFDTTSEEKIRHKTERVLVQIIRDLEESGKLRNVDRRTLLKQVLAEALGLGPLEALLKDDDISEIMVNSAKQIFVEHREHGMILSDASFTSDEQVLHVIRRICAPLGRRINEQTPLVDGRLADGSRVNAIIPPLAVSGPSLTIRKFPKDRLGIKDLVNFGSMTKEMGDFLQLSVQERLNICISGGTGSGKTTLLNVISSFIRESDRVVTVEDVSEIKLGQPHVVTLETRPANLEGEGEISIRDLLKNTLRMRPDRIIVGECRGGEALDMLQAMNTGHDGSLTTIHSNSPRDCVARLETLVLFAGSDLPSRAIREQIASAIHLIVQQTRLHDGSRKVIAISEITGMESGIVTMQDIFTFKQSGFDKKGKVIGQHLATGNIPKFVHTLRRRGVEVDINMFAIKKQKQKPEKEERGRGRRR